MAQRRKRQPTEKDIVVPYKAIPPLADYIDRIGAEQISFNRFMIKEYDDNNYYTEKVLIKIYRGEVFCTNKNYAPTKDEAVAIKAALSSVEFPKSIQANNIDELRTLLGKDAMLFEIIDRKTNKIVMVQQRIQDGANKGYPPWSFWSDGEWRCMEPDCPLPFWKPKKKPKDINRIMVHEGAKAAAFTDALINDPQALADHPWGEDLARFEHWGMLGGALAPHRADFSELRREKASEVVYVCDNDENGQQVMQEVSKHYGRSMKGIRFDKRWKYGFDLADPWPKDFWIDGRYIGPRMSDQIVPATMATEQLPSPDGKGKITLLTRDFKNEWLHCVKPKVFVHKDWPDTMLTDQEFNNWVAPFSHVSNTDALMMKDAASKSAVLKYSPALPSGIYGSNDDVRFINTFVPCAIKPEKGDIKPWMDFMNRLITVDEDRKELMRWCATLIARPDIKMNYGVLLISEEQGVGKGTLGEKILMPLVGATNASVPSENEIVESPYNYWMAHKRLAVVHEIYAGHSAKAYNKLKSVITDRHIEVSKKYMANYLIENWVHVFACSNSMRAIQLSHDDRRWLVPRVSKIIPPNEYWLNFFRWLNEQGGLEIIAWWAYEWLKENEHVKPGANAPWTSLKTEVVEEGYSPGQLLVVRLLDQINSTIKEDKKTLREWEDKGYVRNGQLFTLDTSFQAVIKNQLYDGRHNDRLERPATIRKIAKSKGWFISEHRSQVKEWAALGARMICTSKELAETQPSLLCNEKMPPEQRMRPLDLSLLTKF